MLNNGRFRKMRFATGTEAGFVPSDATAAQHATTAALRGEIAKSRGANEDPHLVALALAVESAAVLWESHFAADCLWSRKEGRIVKSPYPRLNARYCKAKAALARAIRRRGGWACIANHHVYALMESLGNEFTEDDAIMARFNLSDLIERHPDDDAIFAAPDTDVAAVIRGRGGLAAVASGSLLVLAEAFACHGQTHVGSMLIEDDVDLVVRISLATIVG